MMKNKPFVAWMAVFLPLLLVSASRAETQILYQDEHGMRVGYEFEDTGVHTYCASSPENDEYYTDKRIKIWKVSLRITNGSDRRIKPLSAGIAWINVDPNQGSVLEYCFYHYVGDLKKVDGYGDQTKFMFSIASGYFLIPPGRTISNSSYLYLYEDQEPALTDWVFGGYEFLKDARKGSQTSPPRHRTGQAKTIEVPPASAPTGRLSRPSNGPTSGPSGSPLLLIDVSGSMSGTKLSSAKRAAIDTVRKAVWTKTEIAVLSFEGIAGISTAFWQN